MVVTAPASVTAHGITVTRNCGGLFFALLSPDLNLKAERDRQEFLFFSYYLKVASTLLIPAFY